jgi:hypothetical protein
VMSRAYSCGPLSERHCRSFAVGIELHESTDKPPRDQAKKQFVTTRVGHSAECPLARRCLSRLPTCNAVLHTAGSETVAMGEPMAEQAAREATKSDTVSYARSRATHSILWSHTVATGNHVSIHSVNARAGEEGEVRRSHAEVP